jgi:hypothetical protein
MSSGAPRAHAYTAIASRNDVPLEERRQFVECALKELSSVEISSETRTATNNLFGVVRRLSLDPELTRAAFTEYLKSTQNADRDPEEYYVLAQAELDAGVTIDVHDPILAANRAVVTANFA